MAPFGVNHVTALLIVNDVIAPSGVKGVAGALKLRRWVCGTVLYSTCVRQNRSLPLQP